MFEILFKYPASLFRKGHFVFLTPWPLWLLAIAILVAGIVLFWHVRRNHGMLSGLRPVAIWVLETCMVALILFLLWHPALSVATLRPQQNVVAVLVDDSRSMSIADSGGTREAAARQALDSGLLKALGQKFQVRLYKFGKEPERIQKTDQLAGAAPASRIGDTLERVLAESSSLPLGAIVMLSDGADNSGGIDLDTISAIRRQRIPVHTIGFGREHPDKDVEIADVIVPARALPQSRLTAIVSLAELRIVRRQSQTLRARWRQGPRHPGRHPQRRRPDPERDHGLQLRRSRPQEPRNRRRSDPRRGQRLNNKVTRLVNVEARKPRILYIEGEPRWEYKFIRRAVEDDPDIELARMLRTTQNKLYRQVPHEYGQA